MEDKNILENLSKIQDIKPKNSSFESDLREHIIAQRKKDMNNSVSFMGIFTLAFTGIALGLVIISVGVFSLGLFNEKVNHIESETSESNNSEVATKESTLDINGNKVTASEITIDGYWINITVPNDNTNNLKSFNPIEPTELIFEFDQMKMNISSKFDSNSFSSWPQTPVKLGKLTLVNYQKKDINGSLIESIYFSQSPNIYINFSSTSKIETSVMDSIVSSLSYNDPYDGWETKKIEDHTTLKLNDNWSIKGSSVVRKLSNNNAIENIKISVVDSPEYFKNSDKILKIYSKEFGDQSKNIDSYKEYFEGEKIISAYSQGESLIIVSISCKNSICSDSVNLPSESQEEVNLIISSMTILPSKTSTISLTPTKFKITLEKSEYKLKTDSDSDKTIEINSKSAFIYSSSEIQDLENVIDESYDFPENTESIDMLGDKVKIDEGFLNSTFEFQKYYKIYKFENGSSLLIISLDRNSVVELSKMITN